MTDVLRAELSQVLDANSLRLRDALRREIDRLDALEPDQRLQLEIDPNFYGVSFVATEEEILPDGWLDDFAKNGRARGRSLRRLGWRPGKASFGVDRRCLA